MKSKKEGGRMKMKSILFAGIIASQGAFASLPPAGDTREVRELTHEQMQEALAILLNEGIIEWVDGHFILKDRDALEQLRERGRHDLIMAADHSICF